ncbi:MAG: DNA polymerase III subunit alpha [Planctomycetaceae bacterium]|nr:DNA polymerase III subunit alpha [Planctomycetaceae bacterium]
MKTTPPPRALLGVQTYYSLNWGTGSPADWFRIAAELGYTHLGITDHAALYGLPETVGLAGKYDGVRPLYGVSFPYADGKGVLAFVRLHIGYGNMCQRITDWHELAASAPPANAGGLPVLEPERGRRFFAEGKRYDGLIFLTNDAPTWHSLRRGGAEVYWRIGPTMAAPPRGVDPHSAVFAPGPVFRTPDDYLTHRLLRAVGAADTVDRIPEAERYDALGGVTPYLSAPPGLVAASPDSYDDRFAAFADAIDRANRLAEELAGFEPNTGVIFPPLPDNDRAGDAGESALARLRRLAYEGAVQRYGFVNDAARERLERELGIIGQKGFAEYFLIVQDIVNRLAGGDRRVNRGRSITCGRGSGAASLVNYCLGVTNVDVLKHDLMFERFLNEGRTDPPDIDVDFAWDERDGILDSVFAQYGRDKVGRVANHNRYDWRGAFRAVARALGHADTEISRRLSTQPEIHAAVFNSRLPAPKPTAAHQFMPSRVMRQLTALGKVQASNWETVAELSKRLAGLPHGLSMHCGGLVVSPGVLARTVPLQISRKGQPTIQWEKDGAEEMGLVKIDLLGNRSLAVIRDAVRAISRDYSIPEEQVITGDPTEDKETQRLLQTGNTFGVFYLESPSMRLLMAKARQGDFKHAVVHSSIIRPAANAFIQEYLTRVHSGGNWDWDNNILREKRAFEESYGIPVYQEDIVKLSMYLCNYSYEEADKLRKALGKRNAEERLREMYPDLEQAAKENGVDDKTMHNFWRALMSMTGYSFCKPHSASFAQVSFESAYIRAHYPAYFIAGVLSNGGGYYSAQAYVSEAMRMGLGVLRPDVNASTIAWTAEGAAIRTGLMAISGLSADSMRAVVDERGRGGPYRSLEDFLSRTALATDDVRRLVLVGALDGLEPGWNRPQLLWKGVDGRHEASAKARVPRTGSLFARAEPKETDATPPDLPDYTEAQRLEAEYASMGFIPGCHPMILYREEIAAGMDFYRRRKKPRLIEAADLAKHSGELVTLLLWPITAKIVETRHGEAMMFQSFEDPRSLCEAVVFPEEFRKYRKLLASVQPLWVTGKVEEEFDVCTLRVLAIESARQRALREWGEDGSE